MEHAVVNDFKDLVIHTDVSRSPPPFQFDVFMLYEV